MQSCRHFSLVTTATHDKSVWQLSYKYLGAIIGNDNSNTSTVAKYCRGFKPVTANAWGCGACKFGFTGFQVPSLENPAKFFIADCVLMTACNYGVYYNGLNSTLKLPFLDYYTTCHKCSEDGKIPTFTRDRPISANLTWGAIPADFNDNLLPQNSCQPPGLLPDNPNFPSNCGVQEVMTDKLLMR